MKDIRRVRRISAEDKELLAELKRIVLGFVPDAAVVVYGSTARGRRTAESDYDILVLLSAPIPDDEREGMRDTIYDLELARGVVMTVFFLTTEEWCRPLTRVTPFHRNVERDGVAL
jgi:predicted nucleotidyltransferase